MLRQYWELIIYKTYADLRAETERTYMGFLWWIIEPVMFMGVFYVFFGLLLNQNKDGFVAFLLVGLTIWQWFKSCLSHGAESILGGHNLMQQVYLPKIIFPIILILTDSVKFVFIFALLLVFLWLYGYPPSHYYLALPVLILVQLLLITAVSFWLAALIPFFPDLRFVIENLLLAMFFMSGVMIDASVIPDQYLFYYYLNPMTNLLEDFRLVLMHQTWPHLGALAIIAVGSILGILSAHFFIKRFEYTYPKIML